MLAPQQRASCRGRGLPCALSREDRPAALAPARQPGPPMCGQHMSSSRSYTLRATSHQQDNGQPASRKWRRAAVLVTIAFSATTGMSFPRRNPNEPSSNAVQLQTQHAATLQRLWWLGLQAISLEVRNYLFRWDNIFHHYNVVDVVISPAADLFTLCQDFSQDPRHDPWRAIKAEPQPGEAEKVALVTNLLIRPQTLIDVNLQVGCFQIHQRKVSRQTAPPPQCLVAHHHLAAHVALNELI